MIPKIISRAMPSRNKIPMKTKHKFPLKDRARDSVYDVQHWQGRSFADDALTIILVLTVIALSWQNGAQRGAVAQHGTGAKTTNDLPVRVQQLVKDGYIYVKRIGPPN